MKEIFKNQDLFPQYLGFEYNHENFQWTTPAQTASWSWKGTESVIQQIIQAGGVVRRFDEDAIDSDFRHVIEEGTSENQANGWYQHHFQKELTGIEITLPDNVDIKHELMIEISVEKNAAVAVTILLRLGQNSRLKLKSQLKFTGEQTRSSFLISGQLNPASTLEYTLVEESLQPMTQVLLGNVECERDAQCQWNLFPEVSGQLLGDLAIRLSGRGASGEINAARFGQKDDWVGMQGMVEHLAPDTFSRINMRGVLYQESTISFTSVGKINHGAHGANADQESRLMTIEPSAKGSVNPALIIDENDVKAGHAASVGQYDEDELYYLLSRGLSPKVAKQILIDDFMNPVMKKIK